MSYVMFWRPEGGNHFFCFLGDKLKFRSSSYCCMGREGIHRQSRDFLFQNSIHVCVRKQGNEAPNPVNHRKGCVWRSLRFAADLLYMYNTYIHIIPSVYAELVKKWLSDRKGCFSLRDPCWMYHTCMVWYVHVIPSVSRWMLSWWWKKVAEWLKVLFLSSRSKDFSFWVC